MPTPTPADGSEELRAQITDFIARYGDGQPVYHNGEAVIPVSVVLKYVLQVKDDAKAHSLQERKRAEIDARIDEAIKVKSHHVRMGWAGTHNIYQSSFDADKRIKQLEAEKEALNA